MVCQPGGVLQCNQSTDGLASHSSLAQQAKKRGCNHCGTFQHIKC